MWEVGSSAMREGDSSAIRAARGCGVRSAKSRAQPAAARAPPAAAGSRGMHFGARTLSRSPGGFIWVVNGSIETSESGSRSSAIVGAMPVVESWGVVSRVDDCYAKHG